MQRYVVCKELFNHGISWIIEFRISVYGNTQGRRRSDKLKYDNIELKLSFLAFQCWFRIENRTIIKGVIGTFVIFGPLCFGQTMGGGALIRVVPLLGIIR